MPGAGGLTGGNPGRLLLFALAAMEDSTGEPSTRVDSPGLVPELVLDWFLDWGRRLRRLGQVLRRSLLLPEEQWAYQQDGRQQESPG